MNLYNAQISAGSLMLPESRRIAALLLTQPSVDQWAMALKKENILQKKPSTALRQARLIRYRLDTLAPEGWQLVAEGDGELAGQMLLAAAIRHSRLLADFLRDVYGQDIRRLETCLNRQQWDGFLTECAHRDALVSQWSAATKVKLFEVIVRILVEAKYLDSSRHRALTPPLLHPALIAYLTRHSDTDTLARMEFRQ